MRRWMLIVVLLAQACGLAGTGDGGQPSVVPTMVPSEVQPTQVPPTVPPATDEPPTATATEQLAEPTPTATATALSTVNELPDPSGYQWVQVASGLRQPVDVKHAGDGRLFVVERAGVVRVLEQGSLAEQAFLDIRPKVRSGGLEQGLLGLAFHPQFLSNLRFFVYYTDTSGAVVVAEYRALEGGRTADSESEAVMLRIEQPYGNHNGGGLLFGPDGYLYIGVGDGGSAGDPQGHGQNPATLLGSLLRLDVDAAAPYGIPPDNPFAGGGGRPETWSYGLRNPWRFDFDRQTGDLYIADVGQRDWEEVNFQAAGAAGGSNYGWNIREGAHPYRGESQEGLIDPVVEYGHNLGCSITGGVVVRDPQLPAWSGVYLYGDYCSGRVFGMLRDRSGLWQSATLYDLGASISSFGQDLEGRVYLADFGGSIYRLEPIR